MLGYLGRSDSQYGHQQWRRQWATCTLTEYTNGYSRDLDLLLQRLLYPLVSIITRSSPSQSLILVQPSLIVHEMAHATGLSHLYPAVPIMNSLAMVSMLLLIPSFWKTRIIALVAVVSWLFLGNFLYFVGMIYWRGHANDAPVFASICELFISSSNET
jgi:hypothetical protein